MEDKAVCTRLLVNVCLLLVTQHEKCCCAKKADGVFPLLSPNRLQFFEYELIQLKCEGQDPSSEWRVMRRLKGTNALKWETIIGSGNASLAFASDSGEYWCENKEGERSSSVNITVTDGDVILESPSVPVKEGDSVTLNCREKNTDANLPAGFFKDGNFLADGYTEEFTITRVSKSDEGFYKCSISGAGDSPESWLSVTEETEKQTPETPDRAETSSADVSPHSSIILPVVLAVLFVAGLFLVVGLLHCRKNKVGCFSSVTSTPQENSVPLEATDASESVVTYAVVKKFHRKSDKGLSSCSENRTLEAGDRSSFGGEAVVYSGVF